jgi:hypothetical protein
MVMTLRLKNVSYAARSAATTTRTKQSGVPNSLRSSSANGPARQGRSAPRQLHVGQSSISLQHGNPSTRRSSKPTMTRAGLLEFFSPCGDADADQKRQ